MKLERGADQITHRWYICGMAKNVFSQKGSKSGDGNTQRLYVLLEGYVHSHVDRVIYLPKCLISRYLAGG